MDCHMATLSRRIMPQLMDMDLHVIVALHHALSHSDRFDFNRRNMNDYIYTILYKDPPLQ